MGGSGSGAARLNGGLAAKTSQARMIRIRVMRLACIRFSPFKGWSSLIDELNFLNLDAGLPLRSVALVRLGG